MAEDALAAEKAAVQAKQDRLADRARREEETLRSERERTASEVRTLVVKFLEQADGVGAVWIETTGPSGGVKVPYRHRKMGWPLHIDNDRTYWLATDGTTIARLKDGWAGRLSFGGWTTLEPTYGASGLANGLAAILLRIGK